MRPPANIIRQWMNEKNSFSVRGLVMLHHTGKGWFCNIEILRVSREKLEEMPADEAAFEIALSAVFRYITGSVYTGESQPVKTPRGTELLVPTIAFQMAPFLVDRIKKILADGGGGLNVNQIALSQKFLAKSTTGSAKDAEAYGLPKVVSGAQRVKHRLEYEAKLSSLQLKAMARRRKLLARHWLKRKGGSFYRRGLVFSTDAHGFWTFNVRSGQEKVEHTSDDLQALQNLTFEVGVEAVLEYSRAANIDRGGELVLGQGSKNPQGPQLPPDVVDDAARRVAKRLLALMQKHQHGVLSHKVIERSLVHAWDPDDTKSMDDYPFPLAPTTDFHALDLQAMDAISAAFARNRVRKDNPDAPPHGLQADKVATPDSDVSWRQELEIDDWVPLDEPVEDDETLDRKALEKADHDQSAALRRIRGSAHGRILPADRDSPIQHKVDYAGLPKDED
jgi:hypothetical protein